MGLSRFQNDSSNPCRNQRMCDCVTVEMNTSRLQPTSYGNVTQNVETQHG